MASRTPRPTCSRPPTCSRRRLEASTVASCGTWLLDDVALGPFPPPCCTLCLGPWGRGGLCWKGSLQGSPLWHSGPHPAAHCPAPMLVRRLGLQLLNLSPLKGSLRTPRTTPSCLRGVLWPRPQSLGLPLCTFRHHAGGRRELSLPRVALQGCTSAWPFRWDVATLPPSCWPRLHPGLDDLGRLQASSLHAQL